MKRNARAIVSAVLLLGAAAALIAAAASDHAAAPPAGAATGASRPAEEGYVTRVYDVASIINPPRDHPLPEGLSLPGGEVSNNYAYSSGNTLFPTDNAEKALRERVTLTAPLLADMITSAVEPGEWDHRAILRYAGSTFMIRQTPVVHKQIESLLAEIRKGMQPLRRFSISARWVLVDDKQAAQLLPEAGAKRGVPVEVTPEAMKGLDVPYRGELLCADGQLSHIYGGRGQSVLTDASPCIAEFAVSYRPTVRVIAWGAVLQARPTLVAEGDAAIVDLNAMVTAPKELGTIPFAEMAKSTTTAPVTPLHGLDRMDFAVWSLGTTARLPLGKPVLLGGMTAGEIAKGKQMYLVLEVNAAKP